jgi:hypothetical protein
LRSLDAFLPEYEFSERHRVQVRAAPERVDAAMRQVTFADLRVGRMLWALRRFGRPAGDVHRPFVAGALKGSVLLEDSPGEGLVLGLRGDFWRLRGGGDSCQAVIDFRVGNGELTTETRVHVEDPAARRRFRRYWLVIRPFSGLIRIELLRAARRRAEASGS